MLAWKLNGWSKVLIKLIQICYFGRLVSISDKSIATVEFNKTGDWIAFGCSGLGQLLVWEWQSETYVLKQQGHYNNMSCVAYSPDGQNMATGGDDGKVNFFNKITIYLFICLY